MHPVAAEEPAYRERLYVSWWWWPLGLALAVLFGAEFHMGYPGLRAWLPYTITLLLTVATLVYVSRLRVRVDGGELWVDDAHLPLALISDVEPLDERGRRALLGPSGDPDAFVVLRPWVRRAVAIAFDDPDDPTPYWLVSTRNPEALAAAINRARAETVATKPQ